MKLYIVRHGEAYGNINRIFQGITDGEITENGKKQIEKLRDSLKEISFDKIYSSDLKRTKVTCEILAGNSEIIFDERLREIDGGRWENKRFEKIPFLFPISSYFWTRKMHNLKMPGGESIKDLFNRGWSFINDMLNDLDGNEENILIVTHGTMIKVLVSQFKHSTYLKVGEIPWYDNGSLTVVNWDGEKFLVELSGDDSHLGELSTFKKQNWHKEDK